MGIYLKFLGFLVLFFGLLLGGLTYYPRQEYNTFERKLAQVDKKYESFGKEIDALINKQFEKFTLFQQEEFRKVKGISLIIGGIIIGSLLMGLGEVVSLLKRISRK